MLGGARDTRRSNRKLRWYKFHPTKHKSLRFRTTKNNFNSHAGGWSPWTQYAVKSTLCETLLNILQFFSLFSLISLLNVLFKLKFSKNKFLAWKTNYFRRSIFIFSIRIWQNRKKMLKKVTWWINSCPITEVIDLLRIKLSRLASKNSKYSL